MGLRWSSDNLQMEVRWISSKAWMTASGRQHAAELAQIAFGSGGHDGFLKNLREASDELHICRRYLSYEASKTVSESLSKSRRKLVPAGPNADLAILGASFDFTGLGERLRQQVLQFLRQSIKGEPNEHTFTVNDAAVPHRDEPTGDGDDDLAIDNERPCWRPRTAQAVVVKIIMWRAVLNVCRAVTLR